VRYRSRWVERTESRSFCSSVWSVGISFGIYLQREKADLAAALLAGFRMEFSTCPKSYAKE